MSTVDVDSLMPEIEPTDVPPEQPEAEINATPPPDKEPQARDESGKFKGEKKEAAKEPKDVKPEAKPEPKTVPIAAYMEDKKSWQAKLEAMEKELNALKNPPKPPAPEPDYTQDPKGYVDHRVKAALDQLEGANKRVDQIHQTAQQATQQTEQIQFVNHLQAVESAFVRENPDYYDALDHVRQMRAQQLRILAPEITEDQLWSQIKQDEVNFAMQVARAGRNPSATAYQLAQSYGYRKKEAAPSLPDVKKQPQLPPDQTLGSSGNVPNDEQPSNEQRDPFAEAFAEMFGKRKRA